MQRFRLLIVAPIIAVLLAACGASPTGTAPQPTAAPSQPTAVATAPTASSAPSGEMTTVRVGYVPVMVYAPVFVAQERGYFKDEGLNVELVPVQGGSEPVVQLAAGNFEAAVGGAGAGLFNAAARGVKFTIVAPMHSERPPDTTPLVISAKRADEITSVADLKGKKVAINATGAATEYWLAEALKQGGLTFDDITLSSVGFRDVPAALENGSLDAAMLGEPLVTINEDNGVVSVLSEDFIDGFTATYLYMGESLLSNPEAARGFMRAYLRATRDLQGDYMNDEIAQIIEKYTQVPADVTKRAAPPQFEPNGTIPIDDLNTLQNYFLERGELEYQEPLDVNSFVNTELAAEVAQELDAQ